MNLIKYRMNTLLIPIDFSDTSSNVLKYAVEFSKDTAVERIILLNNYYVSVYEQLLPSADFVQVSADEINEERQNIDERLKSIGRKLSKKCGPSIKIETAASELPLLRAIHQIIDQEEPRMLMIGSDNNLDESYIGEQVIAIAKTVNIPVLIVPAGVKYKKIKSALVPCDFNAISRLALLKEIRSSNQRVCPPELIVLNVDPKQAYLAHKEENFRAVKDMLESYQYQVYYSEDRDIVHGILDFANKHGTQLIIALPGNYSFFYNLTHQSITQAVELNARWPVLILK
jgi:nucleotide-binding universal stress UspA family protein